MILQVLHWLNRLHCYGLLNVLSKIGYRLNGFGWVNTYWHPEFRAYEYQIDNVSYLSMGPGWNASYPAYSDMLLQSFCYAYRPKTGDCVIDLGAGLGEESLIMSLWVGSTGRVFAIEANPIVFRGLRFLKEKNHLTQLIPENIAVYSENGYVNIEDVQGNYLVNTIQSKEGSPNHQVAAMTLDAFVEKHNISHIDFLKCNIEGAEKFLIKGMDKSISVIRNLCISCHDFRHVHHSHGEFYMTKKDVRAFLIQHGFEVTDRHTGNPVVDDYLYGRKL
ncbi:MAG: FkbM family methyltransferase [Bacteroidetes bacterium]|nr:FkbM family methyltransferase [Bacteroidota bacterium]